MSDTEYQLGSLQSSVDHILSDIGGLKMSVEAMRHQISDLSEFKAASIGEAKASARVHGLLWGVLSGAGSPVAIEFFKSLFHK